MNQKTIKFLHLFFGIRRIYQSYRLHSPSGKTMKFERLSRYMRVPLVLKKIDALLNTSPIQLLYPKSMKPKYQKLKKRIELPLVKKIKTYAIRSRLMPQIPLTTYKNR